MMIDIMAFDPAPCPKKPPKNHPKKKKKKLNNKQTTQNFNV
jgi:hypothetical protein